MDDRSFLCCPAHQHTSKPQRQRHLIDRSRLLVIESSRGSSAEEAMWGRIQDSFAFLGQEIRDLITAEEVIEVDPNANAAATTTTPGHENPNAVAMLEDPTLLGVLDGTDEASYEDGDDIPEFRELGITPTLKEYVRNLCRHPNTWTEFPIEELVPIKKRNRSMSTAASKATTATTGDTPGAVAADGGASVAPTTSTHGDAAVPSTSTSTDHEQQPGSTSSTSSSSSTSTTTTSIPSAEPTTSTTPQETATAGGGSSSSSSSSSHGSSYEMTTKQQQHAMLILDLVPELQQLRYELCPVKISEDSFWKIYFLLVRNKLCVSLDTDDDSVRILDGKALSLSLSLSLSLVRSCEIE